MAPTFRQAREHVPDRAIGTPQQQPAFEDRFQKKLITFIPLQISVLQLLEIYDLAVAQSSGQSDAAICRRRQVPFLSCAVFLNFVALHFPRYTCLCFVCNIISARLKRCS